MAHKDLSDYWREIVEADARNLVWMLGSRNGSRALGREAWINAFDRAAEEMEAGNGKTEA